MNTQGNISITEVISGSPSLSSLGINAPDIIKISEVVMNTYNVQAPQFIFRQDTPLQVWIISHGLNRFPSVSLADSDGNLTGGDVKYIDSNTITASFIVAFAGVAYLN